MTAAAPKALITGICGFAGSHLTEHLLARGYRVRGIEHPDAGTENLAVVGRRVRVERLDLAAAGPGEIRQAIGRFAPTVVFHLAAIASVRRSWDSVERTLQVNTMGSLRLTEALRSLRRRPALLLVGSADEYGRVPRGGGPTRESASLAPTSPYALSKLWQETLGEYCRRLDGWPVFLVRTFNHTGPRQGPDFVSADFARQIALVEAGRLAPVIKVGNLGASRDFLDVRDVVRAYRLVVEKGKPGVPYNVASGRAWKIREVLRTLLSLARVPIRVAVDPARSRPADIPRLSGDAARLRRATGWRPVIPLERTLADLLDCWRERVAGKGGGLA